MEEGVFFNGAQRAVTDGFGLEARLHQLFPRCHAKIQPIAIGLGILQHHPRADERGPIGSMAEAGADPFDHVPAHLVIGTTHGRSHGNNQLLPASAALLQLADG